MSYYNSFDNFDSFGNDDTQIEFKRNRISSKVKSVPMINAGGAMLIVVFVVLCLTIFGFLSFTTSFADKKLTDKNIKNITEYYKADSIAEHKTAEVFNAVWETLQLTDEKINSEYMHGQLVKNRVITSENIADSGNDDVLSLEFTVPISDTQSLRVAADFFQSENDELNLHYKIKDWSVFLTIDLDYTQKYNVLD